MKEREERVKLVPGKISRELRILVQQRQKSVDEERYGGWDLSEETEGEARKGEKEKEKEWMWVAGSANTHDSIKSIESCRTRLDFTFSWLFTDNDIRDIGGKGRRKKGKKGKKNNDREEFA